MSDFHPPGSDPVGAVPPGPGWWQASDGNWYPPEQHPSAAPPPPAAPGAPPPPGSGNPGYGPPPGYGTPPAYGVPPAYGAPAYASGFAAPKATNGLAIASLVLSIVWLYWVGSVLAIVFGLIALSQIRKSNDTQSGRGMAIAGTTIGMISLVLGVLLVVAVVIFADNIDEFDDINTDPSNGICNPDRYYQDPDC